MSDELTSDAPSLLETCELLGSYEGLFEHAFGEGTSEADAAAIWHFAPLLLTPAAGWTTEEAARPQRPPSATGETVDVGGRRQTGSMTQFVFEGISLISEDVPRLATFYAALLEAEVVGDDTFAIVPTEGARLSFFSARGMEQMRSGSTTGMGTGASTLEFHVDDVDACYARLSPIAPVLKPPTTQPWGRRSVWFRDPDGNIVNLFQPTPQPRDPAEIVREYLTRLLVDRDLGICDDLLAEDYIDHDAPAGTPPGPQATKTYVARMFDEHPDLGFSIDRLVTVGNTVAVEARWRALDQAGLLLVTTAEGRLRTRRSTYWTTADTT